MPFGAITRLYYWYVYGSSTYIIEVKEKMKSISLDGLIGMVDDLDRDTSLEFDADVFRSVGGIHRVYSLLQYKEKHNINYSRVRNKRIGKA